MQAYLPHCTTQAPQTPTMPSNSTSHQQFQTNSLSFGPLLHILQLTVSSSWSWWAVFAPLWVGHTLGLPLQAFITHAAVSGGGVLFASGTSCSTFMPDLITSMEPSISNNCAQVEGTLLSARAAERERKTCVGDAGFVSSCAKRSRAFSLVCCVCKRLSENPCA